MSCSHMRRGRALPRITPIERWGASRRRDYHAKGERRSLPARSLPSAPRSGHVPPPRKLHSSCKHIP